MTLLLLIAALLGFTPNLPGFRPQPLVIALHRDNASLARLPHYHTAAPIDVHVANGSERIDAMTVTAHGPNGAAITTPLARTADGFDGLLRLGEPGAWTLQLTAQLGAVDNTIDAVALDVEPGESDLGGYVALALAVVMTASGTVLVLRRRRAAFADDYQT